MRNMKKICKRKDLREDLKDLDPTCKMDSFLSLSIDRLCHSPDMDEYLRKYQQIGIDGVLHQSRNQYSLFAIEGEATVACI